MYNSINNISGKSISINGNVIQSANNNNNNNNISYNSNSSNNISYSSNSNNNINNKQIIN